MTNNITLPQALVKEAQKEITAKIYDKYREVYSEAPVFESKELEKVFHDTVATLFLDKIIERLKKDVPTEDEGSLQRTFGLSETTARALIAHIRSNHTDTTPP